MSDNPVDMRDATAIDAHTLLARAAVADVRAFRELVVALDDFALPDESRLDEQTRAALTLLVRGLVETLEAEIREGGAGILAARGEPGAGTPLRQVPPVLPRLMRSGLLRDTQLMR